MDFPGKMSPLEVNDRSNDSTKISVRSYASKVFKESTIGIVASIASSHSRARRIFKSLVFFLCIVGFSYQCITFLLHVFQYPTTVDVDIQKPEEFERPAFTFCNNNVIKRSVFCNLFPDRCYIPSDEFCSRYYSYCGENGTLVPKREFYDLEKVFAYEELLNLSHSTFSKFLVENKGSRGDEPRGPYLRSKDGGKGIMVCYTLHSVVDVPEKPRQVYQPRSHMDSGSPSNVLKFYIEEDEMFIPGYRPGVLFSIHSPYMWVNPFKKGIFLKPGRNYKIFVTMLQEVLLKDPFSTDCINYEEVWEANNHTGPRIQEMCRQKCFLDSYLSCMPCASLVVLYPHDSRICYKGEEADTVGNFTCNLKEESIVYHSCVANCKNDCKYVLPQNTPRLSHWQRKTSCGIWVLEENFLLTFIRRDTKYTPEIMERYEVDFNQRESLEHYNRYITVEVILEASEVMTLRHSPKYLTVEVFSSIGGFIGCWLGISLMDIIDVLASVISVSRYSIRKNKKREQLYLQTGNKITL